MGALRDYMASDHERLDCLLDRAAASSERFDLDSFEEFQHAAIASLLVPTPDHALFSEIRTLLVAHNRLEETDGGAYELVEALAGTEADSLLQRARTAPTPPPARHFDGPGVYRTAADALALAERNAARKRKG